MWRERARVSGLLLCDHWARVRGESQRHERSLLRLHLGERLPFGHGMQHSHEEMLRELRDRQSLRLQRRVLLKRFLRKRNDTGRLRDEWWRVQRLFERIHQQSLRRGRLRLRYANGLRGESGLRHGCEVMHVLVRLRWRDGMQRRMLFGRDMRWRQRSQCVWFCGRRLHGLRWGGQRQDLSGRDLRLQFGDRLRREQRLRHVDEKMRNVLWCTHSNGLQPGMLWWRGLQGRHGG
jgi:hypothetical protein